MTTHYIVVSETATVESVIEAMREFEGSLESIHSVYLIDAEEHLAGRRAPGAHPAGAGQDAAPGAFPRGGPQRADGNGREGGDRSVQKYNLLALPVVDDKQHLVGVVTADDVLDLVVNRVEGGPASAAASRRRRQMVRGTGRNSRVIAGKVRRQRAPAEVTHGSQSFKKLSDQAADLPGRGGPGDYHGQRG